MQPSSALPCWCLSFRFACFASLCPLFLSGPCLSRSLHENEDIFDWAITFKEEISNTEGLKVIFPEKPMIVHTPAGSAKIGAWKLKLTCAVRLWCRLGSSLVGDFDRPASTGVYDGAREDFGAFRETDVLHDVPRLVLGL